MNYKWIKWEKIYVQILKLNMCMKLFTISILNFQINLVNLYNKLPLTFAKPNHDYQVDKHV